MKLLLDSNVLLWAVFSRSRLTPLTRRAIEDAGNELFVSTASMWELAIKVAKGKLSMPGDSTAYLFDQVTDIGIMLLPITPAHILRTETLPHHHGDPFDRMIIAQALSDDLTVLTSDRIFAAYGVKLL